MDFDGEPIHFLEHDVDMSRPTCMLLSRSSSFPSWRGLWSHHSYEVDTSLLIGCEDFVSFSVAQSCESRTQHGSNTTEWQLQQGRHGVKLVRCETWSYMSTSLIDLLSESSVVQPQQTDTTADSCVATFIAGEELAEAQNTVTVSRVSAPTPSSESGKRSKLEPNRQDRLLNLRDVVPSQTDHIIILSAIKSFDQLVSGRRDSKVDTNLDGEQFRQDQNDVQQSLTSASQQHQSEACNERSRCFGLPSRVTVSMREINMMSPSSF